MRTRFSLKALLTIVAVIAVICAYCGRLRTLAGREYAAYHELCELGAEGDDWISPKELITGRPPIVQIRIPASIDPQVTMTLLPTLNNLEALTLEYDTMTANDMRVVESLSLRSLTFCGGFPTDDDIEQLSIFDTVPFLTLPAERLSDQSISHLQELLPHTKLVLR